MTPMAMAGHILDIELRNTYEERESLAKQNALPKTRDIILRQRMEFLENGKKACNAHDELVEYFKNAIKIIHYYHGDSKTVRDMKAIVEKHKL